MELLNFNDINFNILKELDYKNATESTLYYNDKTIYKIYKNFIESYRKKNKILLLNDGERISNVIIPDKLILDGSFTLGCGMKYISDANTFGKYRNNNSFILLLYIISLSLKKIHTDPRNIVIGDLHFGNIIIDSNLNYYFIDMDSCMIDGLLPERLPNIIVSYAKNRGNFNFDISRETDKLCMFLSTIEAIFNKDIDKLSMYEYDKKAEEINTLKNMKRYFLEIKNATNYIPNIPYFDELISINDFPIFTKIKTRNR